MMSYKVKGDILENTVDENGGYFINGQARDILIKDIKKIKKKNKYNTALLKELSDLLEVLEPRR